MIGKCIYTCRKIKNNNIKFAKQKMKTALDDYTKLNKICFY